MDELEVAPRAAVCPRTADWNASAELRARPWQAIYWRLGQLNLVVLAIFVAMFLAWGFFPKFRGFVPLIAIGLSASLHYRKRPSPKMRSLEESSSTIKGYPVDLGLFYKGIAYGKDAGIVSFVDGWLVYEGEDCRVSLRSKDVRVAKYASLGNQGNGFLLLEWGDGDSRRIIGFRPRGIRMSLRPTTEIQTPFGRDFERWSYSGAPDGTSLFPPASAHPAVRALNRLSLAASAGFSLVGVSALVWSRHLADPFSDVMCVGCFSLAMSLIVGAYAAYNQRVLRRLELLDSPTVLTDSNA